MLIRFVLILALTFLPFWGGYGLESVLAQNRTCSVRDIIKLVDQGLSRAKIRAQCQKVAVPNCKRTEVIRMAENGKSSRQIYKECGRPSR